MISFTVNGQPARVDVEADKPLLWVLREDLNIVGPKYGCGVASCGACTVHVDGAAGALVLDGGVRRRRQDGLTIEGLALGQLHAVQKAWIEQQVPQCGYCQPGFIMSAVALLKANPKPSDKRHRRGPVQHLPLRHLQRHPPRRASRGGAAGRRAVKKSTRRMAIIGGVAGGGLLGVGFWFARERDRLGDRTLFNVKPNEAGLNGWVKITRDNGVIVAVPRAEMGQGVQTALAMLVAEEMDARWDAGAGRGSARARRLSQCRHPDRRPAVLARGDRHRRRYRALDGGQAGRRAGRAGDRRFDRACATPGCRCASRARWRATCCCARRAARRACRSASSSSSTARCAAERRPRSPRFGELVDYVGDLVVDAGAAAQEAVGVQADRQAAAAPRHPGQGRRAAATFGIDVRQPESSLCRGAQRADLRRLGDRLQVKGSLPKGVETVIDRAGRHRRHRHELVARQQAPRGRHRGPVAARARAQARQRHACGGATRS